MLLNVNQYLTLKEIMLHLSSNTVHCYVDVDIDIVDATDDKDASHIADYTI